MEYDAGGVMCASPIVDLVGKTKNNSCELPAAGYWLLAVSIR